MEETLKENTENLVITDINTLGICYEKFPIQDSIIHFNNDNGVKFIELYTIVEDIKTNEKRKMKIRINCDSFMFLDVDEKEWNENVCQ